AGRRRAPDRYPRGSRVRLRGGATALHGLGAQELLRCAPAVAVRGRRPGWRVPRAHPGLDRAAHRRAGAGGDRDLQPGGLLVRVRAGPGPARLAEALHDPGGTLQLPERLRDRVAARGGGQLPRPGAGDGRLRLPAAVLHGRTHGRGGEGMSLDVHVVSHTHWDREWYFTREQFRLRLVDLIDRMLELLDSEPRFRYFHLDGQTIVLEDYLEVRPEQRERLRRHVP